MRFVKLKDNLITSTPIQKINF